MNTRILSLVTSFLFVGVLEAAPLVVVEDGKAKAAIYVPARVMTAPHKKFVPNPGSLRPEDLRLRLQESVIDFADILKRIGGVKIDVVQGAPMPGDKRIPILIGELATTKPAKKFPYGQGFRITVNAKGVGITGETDLATSYALYTLLDQLGCRWYMPGTLGEVLPAQKTIALPEQDLSSGPYTYFRGIWYADNAYRLRNRMGGMLLHAGHALEFIVSKELRESHPEIKAIFKGKVDEHRVKWTHPLVAKAISDSILASLAKDPSQKSFSLSPDDLMGWDESDDTKFDAGDFDPAVQGISRTDRLMVLANRVGDVVAAKYPDVRLGILAYSECFRPPVREKVHRIVVPQIAPITYSRAHPITDDGEPNNKAFRSIVEGWAKVAPATSYYFYGWYLAEPSAPNPMMTKWGIEVPYAFEKGACRYWQPETQPTFETNMHNLYLGNRLAWDPKQKPEAIFDELHRLFYGAAGKQMSDYWHFIDNVWVSVPEYSGCGFGYLRRWTPERMKQARELMNAALAAAKTQVEKNRVQLADESLRLFELFMKLRRDQAEGRFANLAADAESWRKQIAAAAERYDANFAFTKKGSVNGSYFGQFYQRTYTDATKVAQNFDIITTPVLRQFKYQVDADHKGEKLGWMAPEFDDSGWKSTDVCMETWSTLGQHNYMGSLWYRTTVKLPAVPAGKKAHLWIGSTDGRVKVFVNGKHLPYVDPKKGPADSFTGYCQPVSFDVTATLIPGDNQISLLCTREFLNELGTGGLLSPAVIYRDK